jgi:hypothetical protein
MRAKCFFDPFKPEDFTFTYKALREITLGFGIKNRQLLVT